MPIAVVTGAASGIGAACARMLTDAGYTVTGIDLQPAPDCASSFEVDVADADAVETLFAAVERDLGQVDAVVTAAGFYEWVPLFDLDEAMVDRAVDVLLSGTANVCRAALRRMIPRAHGAICTIGSELGLTGDADASGDAHAAISTANEMIEACLKARADVKFIWRHLKLRRQVMQRPLEQQFQRRPQVPLLSLWFQFVSTSS